MSANAPGIRFVANDCGYLKDAPVLGRKGSFVCRCSIGSAPSRRPASTAGWSRRPPSPSTCASARSTRLSVFKTAAGQALRHQRTGDRRRSFSASRSSCSACPPRSAAPGSSAAARARRCSLAACFWAPASWSAPLGVATAAALAASTSATACIGGIGLGIGYISPVSTLIKWFPDRPGLATGLAIMGFGGGALIASRCRAADASYDPTSTRRRLGASGVAVGDAVRHPRRHLLRLHDVRRLQRPGAADGWRPAGCDPPSVKAKTLVTTGNVSAAQRDQDPAVLAALGGAVLQRHRGHRHPRAGRRR